MKLTARIVGTAYALTVFAWADAATAVQWYGRDLNVRGLVQRGDGALMLATDKGLCELKRGEQITRAKGNSELLSRSMNAVAMDDAGRLWLAADHGLIVSRENGAKLMESVPPRSSHAQGQNTSTAGARYDLPPVLSVTTKGSLVVAGTTASIVEFDAGINRWRVAGTYCEWKAIVQAVLVIERSISQCSRVCVDAASRGWAITDTALLTAGAAAQRQFSWQTGYRGMTSGAGVVLVSLWAFLKTPGTGRDGRPIYHPVADGTAHPTYGPPVDLALDEAGAVTVLTTDGHVLREPSVPGHADTPIRIDAFPEAADGTWLRSISAKPACLAWSGHRLAVASNAWDDTQAVLTTGGPAGAGVHSVGLGAVRVNQVSWDRQGHCAWVATDHGLGCVAADSNED